MEPASIWAEIDALPLYAHWRDNGLHLHYAVQTNNISLLGQLLTTGAIDIEQQHPDGSIGTPLQLAARYGHVQAIKLLLQYGAKPTAPESSEPGSLPLKPALFLAAWYGHFAAVKALLDAGAHESTAYTVFEIGGFAGHVDLMHNLLDWSDAWTERDKSMALIGASAGRHAEVVKLLLDRIAYTPYTLHSALSVSLTRIPDESSDWPQLRPLYSDTDSAAQAQIITLLFDAGTDMKSERDPDEPYGRSYLNDAVGEHGSAAVVRILLERGAVVDAMLLNNGTALTTALANGNEETATVLMDYGASICIPDLSGMLPIQLAAAKGFVSVFSRLLAQGADPLVRLSGGKSVVHIAAANGQLGILRLLVTCGVDVNDLTRQGLTPLMYACSSTDVDSTFDVVRFLLDQGAAVNAATDLGVTALYVALEFPDPKLAEMLLSSGADTNTRAIIPNRPLNIRPLIEVVETTHPQRMLHGQTPLHWASSICRADQVAILLRHGADVHTEDDEHHTPIVRMLYSYLASSSQIAAVLTLLFEAGADPDELSNEHDSPMALAVRENLQYDFKTRTLHPDSLRSATISSDETEELVQYDYSIFCK